MAGFAEKLFNYQKNGPGVKKTPGNSYSMSEFWRIYRAKFFNLLALNLMYVVCLVIVGLICWVPISNFVLKDNYMVDKLNSYNLNSSYTTVISNFCESYKISDEAADEALPHFKSALDSIKAVNPDAITDGVDAFDLSKYSDADLESVYSELKLGFDKVGFKLDNAKSSAESINSYKLTDPSDELVLEIDISAQKLVITDKLPRSITDLLVLILCLLPIILLGPINLAFIRLTRDYVQGSPSFMFSDIWDTIKKNWWQSFVIAALEYVGFSCLAVALIWYYTYINSGTFFVVGFSLCIFIAYIFVSMSFYIGMMQVTLDMGLRKIIKNAFYFSVICMGKNILMILVLAALVIGLFALVIFGMAYTLVMSLTVTFVLIALFGFWYYFVSFMTYPSLRRYVIDPYYESIAEKNEHDNSDETADDASADEEESVPEYVYHNGRMVHRSVLEQQTLFNDEPFDK